MSRLLALVGILLISLLAPAAHAVGIRAHTRVTADASAILGPGADQIVPGEDVLIEITLNDLSSDTTPEPGIGTFFSLVDSVIVDFQTSGLRFAGGRVLNIRTEDDMPPGTDALSFETGLPGSRFGIVIGSFFQVGGAGDLVVGDRPTSGSTLFTEGMLELDGIVFPQGFVERITVPLQGGTLTPLTALPETGPATLLAFSLVAAFLHRGRRRAHRVGRVSRLGFFVLVPLVALSARPAGAARIGIEIDAIVETTLSTTHDLSGLAPGDPAVVRFVYDDAVADTNPETRRGLFLNAITEASVEFPNASLLVEFEAGPGTVTTLATSNDLGLSPVDELAVTIGGGGLSTSSQVDGDAVLGLGLTFVESGFISARVPTLITLQDGRPLPNPPFLLLAPVGSASNFVTLSGFVGGDPAEPFVDTITLNTIQGVRFDVPEPRPIALIGLGILALGARTSRS